MKKENKGYSSSKNEQLKVENRIYTSNIIYTRK